MLLFIEAPEARVHSFEITTSMCWLAFARIVATLLANLRNTAGAHPDMTPGVRRIELSGRGPAPPIGLA